MQVEVRLSGSNLAIFNFFGYVGISRYIKRLVYNSFPGTPAFKIAIIYKVFPGGTDLARRDCFRNIGISFLIPSLVNRNRRQEFCE